MIVKNERPVIERSLASVKNLIDHWVIVDTGSTDGTQDLIRDFLKDLPGNLFEKPWVAFDVNRNQALDLSFGKSDYILFIDADEEWVCSQKLDKTKLDKDFYTVMNRDQNVDLHRIALIKNDGGWRWEGIKHEEIRPLKRVSGDVLEGIINLGFRRDGSESQNPDRFLQHAAALEIALAADPKNGRTVFFLAQSYGAAKEYALALKYYEQRSKMGGFSDEVFWSLFQIGCLQEELRMEPEAIIDSYCRAFQFDPTRAEPLHHLASFYHNNHKHLLGYILSKFALTLPKPRVASYILRDVYSYSLLLKYSCCAHFIGKLDEALDGYRELLKNPELPDRYRAIVENNLSYSASSS